ncbi:MAG TPA: SDR family oxidoreductase [Terriglobales bacterium]|nr:SDR family oxidoreductase [Terriglobales bacterium]
MKALVTGASGYIGGELIAHLLLRGHEVRCMVRGSSRFRHEGSGSVEVVEADSLQADERLNEAVKGIDVAYYLIHSMDKDGNDFEDRDRKAARNFAAAAKAAGVKKVVYLGGLGRNTSQMSSHLKSRQETGEILRQFGPDVIEFRAAIIVGNGSVSFEIIRLLAERLPVMICPRWVITRVQPIAIKDVLAYLVAAAEGRVTGSAIVEIGGASLETYNSMILKYARLRGLRRSMLRVPVLTPRLSSYWLDLVTPIPPSISRPLIEGLRSEVICHDRSAAELFPDIHPVDYEAAIRTALDRRIPLHLVAEKMRGDCGGSRVTRVLVREQGFIFDVRESVVKTTAQRTFSVIEGIGGRRGWLYADSLWQLRGWMDRAIGGEGMRRGRVDPNRLRIDDVLDFWNVEEIERPRLLRLRAEMKLPGRAWLQFECVESSETETKLRTTAIFEPRGLAGELYWAATYPAHSIIFNGMHRAIAHRAESA